jgi:hypothetical protein
MRVLSVRQPWAWAVARGQKPIENRNWDTTYRGELAIHASLRLDTDALESPLVRGAGWDPADPIAAAGMIVAVVSLTDVCAAATSGEPCDCGPWAEAGYFHWRLGDVRPLPRPFATTGQPSLWTASPDLAAEVAGILAGRAGH